MDENGLVTAANAAAGALFRMPAADLLGRTLPEPFDSLAVDTSAAPGGGERLPRAAIRSRGDGAWIEAISSPFIDPSGQRQVQVILRDVRLGVRATVGTRFGIALALLIGLD